jgi:hypothetical protein
MDNIFVITASADEIFSELSQQNQILYSYRTQKRIVFLRFPNLCSKGTFLGMDVYVLTALTGVRVDSVQTHQFTVEFSLQLSVKN